MNSASRHVAATVAALVPLAFVPWVAVRLSWVVASALGETGGMSECCSAEPSISSAAGVVSNPLQPALLAALALAAIGGAVTVACSQRWALAWVIAPVVMAIGLGVAVAGEAWRNLPSDLSWAVPATLGATVASCFAGVEAVYVAMLWLTRTNGRQRQLAALQNDEMQLTRPAQATEPRS